MKTILAFASAVLLSGCYVETMQHEKDKNKDAPQVNLENCPSSKYEPQIGCLQISLPAAPGIEISGMQFRSATEFGQSLSTFLKVDDPQGSDDPATQEKEVSTYAISAVQIVTDKNWSSNFNLSIKGPKVVNGSSNFNNGFSINDLPEGPDYQARLEKEVAVEITRTTVKKNADGSVMTDAKPVEKKFNRCLTIYKEFAFEVVGTKRTAILFDKFDMYKPQETCSTKVTGEPVINL